MTVVGGQRRNVATYQFAATVLAEISEMKFTTYNPSATNPGSPNRSGYLHFNVDFDGSDLWQRRLIFLPANNGNVKPDKWQEWDTIRTGAAQWTYSGQNWPAPNQGQLGSVPLSWDKILADYPGVRIRTTDAFLGIRMGEPYADGFTGNVGSFTLGTTETKVFDFEPD